MHAQKQVSVSLRCIEFILILFQAINAIKLIFTHMTNSDLHTMQIHCQTMTLRYKCEQPSLKVTSIKLGTYIYTSTIGSGNYQKHSAMYRNTSFEFRIGQLNHPISINKCNQLHVYRYKTVRSQTYSKMLGFTLNWSQFGRSS